MIRNSYLLSSRTTLHLARAGPEWMLGISKGMSSHKQRTNHLHCCQGISVADAVRPCVIFPCCCNASACATTSGRPLRCAVRRCRSQEKSELRTTCKVRAEALPTRKDKLPRANRPFCPSLPPCHGALRLPKYNGLEGFGAWAWYSLRPKVTDIRFRGAVRGRIKFRTD